MSVRVHSARRAEPEAPAAEEPAAEGFFLRAVLLLLLLVAIDLWAEHHLGLGLANPGWLGALFATFAAAAAALDRLLESSEREELQEKLRAVARPLLATPTLIILSATFLILAASFASVMVTGEGEEVGEATLSPLGEAEPYGAFGEPPRYWVSTGPFGRSLRLKVPGYNTATVHVPPLLGLRVLPERDLQRSPSILLRPPPPALQSLARCGADGRCGYFEVWATIEGRRVELARSEGQRSSFLLGQATTLPPGLFADWQMELRVLTYNEEQTFEDEREERAAEKAQERLVMRTMLNWKQPTHLAPPIDLEPRMVVHAGVFTRAGKPKANAEIALGSQAFLDVLMEEPKR